jgi:hypothetical protein
VQMVLEMPFRIGGSDRDDNDGDQKPEAELPLLRSRQAQAALIARAEAAVAEQRDQVSEASAADAKARRMRSEHTDLDAQLYYAKKAFKEAEANEARIAQAAEAAAARLQQAETIQAASLLKMRPARRAHLQALQRESEELSAAARAAEAETVKCRTERALLAQAMNKMAHDVARAEVAAKEAQAAAQATADRVAALHSEAGAQDRVRSAMVGDALSVVASSAILVDAIVPAAGEVLASALGLERKDTAEERRAKKRERERGEEMARQRAHTQAEAERVLACGADDHLGVLSVDERADKSELRQAFWECIERFHPERCRSPLGASALQRATDAFAALAGGTWEAQAELEAATAKMGLRVQRKSYYDYIPPP